jgi:hypothetical protein
MKNVIMGLMFCKALATPIGMYFNEPIANATLIEFIIARVTSNLKPLIGVGIPL